MPYKLNISNVGLVIFHKSKSPKSGFEIALETYSKLGNIFTKPPIILPENPPPEVPQVIFINEEGLQFVVTQVKTDILLSVRDLIKEETLKQFKSLTYQGWSIVNNFGCSIYRLGFVVNGNIKLEDPGMEFIRNRYLNKEHFLDICSAEAHWHKIIRMSDDDINRWVRIKYANLDY